MKKYYITPNRKWLGFAPLSDNGTVETGFWRNCAVLDMYAVFDKIGEGVMCSIKIEKDNAGGVTLSFDKQSLRFLERYHINVERWLDSAYNYILHCDVFIVLGEDGNVDPINNDKDFVLIDNNSFTYPSILT